MSASRDDFGIAIRSALLQRGAKQKFSLIFYLIIGLIVFFIDIYPSKITKITRSLLNDGIYTVSSSISFPFKLIPEIKDKTINHFSLYKENEILKKKLELLEEKDFNQQFLITENKRLKDVLDSENLGTIDTISAKVFLDKDSPFLKSVIINKGSKSGVKKGMPVVDGNYLVGRIVEVNFLTSRVLLLNDLNSKIPVMIETSGVQAILSGMGDKEPTLQYLPELFEGEENKTVFTSGKDGIFPPGVAIGETLIVEEKVLVKLFSTPSQLSFVKIMDKEIGNFK